MRRLVIALSLLPTLAFAQAPQQPTIRMPLAVIQRLGSLLSDPVTVKLIPMYQADFVPLLQASQSCANVQFPDTSAASRARGECPEVVAAEAADAQATAKMVTDAVAKAKAAAVPPDAPKP